MHLPIVSSAGRDPSNAQPHLTLFEGGLSPMCTGLRSHVQNLRIRNESAILTLYESPICSVKEPIPIAQGQGRSPVSDAHQ